MTFQNKWALSGLCNKAQFNKRTRRIHPFKRSCGPTETGHEDGTERVWLRFLRAKRRKMRLPWFCVVVHSLLRIYSLYQRERIVCKSERREPRTSCTAPPRAIRIPSSLRICRETHFPFLEELWGVVPFTEKEISFTVSKSLLSLEISGMPKHAAFPTGCSSCISALPARACRMPSTAVQCRMHRAVATRA